MAVKKGKTRGVRGHFVLLVAKLKGLFEGLANVYGNNVSEIEKYIPRLEQLEEKSIKFKRWAVVSDVLTKDNIEDYINQLGQIYASYTQNATIQQINYRTLVLLLETLQRVKELEEATTKGDKALRAYRRRIMRAKIFTSIAGVIHVFDTTTKSMTRQSIIYAYALDIDWQFRIKAELSKEYKIESVSDIFEDDSFDAEKIKIFKDESLSNMLVQPTNTPTTKEGFQDVFTHWRNFVENLINKLKNLNLADNQIAFITIITNPQDYNTYKSFNRMLDNILNNLGDKKDNVKQKIDEELNETLQALTSQLASVQSEIGVFIYPGAKWSKAEVINKVFPEHRIYVEPYLGSGSVFASKEKGAEIAILNDIRTSVIDFWKDVAFDRIKEDEISSWWDRLYEKYGKPLISDRHKPKDMSLYQFRKQAVIEHLDEAEKNPSLRFILSFILPRLFYDIEVEAVKLRSKKTILKRLQKAKEALQKHKDIYFFNTDAILLLDELRELIDREDTLIYLDPPYIVGSEKFYKENDAYQHNVKLVEVLKKYKNATIFMHNYDPILELLPDWYVVDERELRSFASSIKDRSFNAKEVLITNKPPAL